MLVERRTVSRKTPLDGRLEITRVGAARLGGIGDGFELAIGETNAPARLGTLECTCRGLERPQRQPAGSGIGDRIGGGLLAK